MTVKWKRRRLSRHENVKRLCIIEDLSKAHPLANRKWIADSIRQFGPFYGRLLVEDIMCDIEERGKSYEKSKL